MRAAEVLYLGREIVAGIVAGDEAVMRLTNLVGHHFDPKVCAPGTLRRRYAGPDAFVDETVFFQNAVHRPRDAVDVSHFIRWFLGFI